MAPVLLLLLDLLLALLIAQLGSTAFPARRQAGEALAALGPLALPHLERARTHRDPEVRRAAGLLLEDWRATFRPTSSPVPPWIDMLPTDYPERNAVISRLLDVARGGYGYGLDDWPDYRLATVLLVDELRAAGWSRPRVVALLDGMALKEQQYMWQHARPVE